MTPERRAELRALAMQAVAADYIEVIALLDALDLADARERRLREALRAVLVHCGDADDPADRRTWDRDEREIRGALDDIRHSARAALSEVAPDA